MNNRIDRNHWLYTLPIAHRGLHNDMYGENTLAAYQNAIDNGYAIEIDVRMSGDGNVIVFHDHNLTRATGDTDNRCIADMTLNEIKRVKVFGGHIIPTLKETLAFVAGKVPLLIEVKRNANAGDQLEISADEILKEYDGEYAVQSFNPYSVLWYKNNRPNVLRGQLASFFRGGDKPKFFERIVLKRMMFNATSKPDFISYNTHDIPNKYAAKYVRKNDVPLIAWTVRGEEEAARVKRFADNIIFENFLFKRK